MRTRGRWLGVMLGLAVVVVGCRSQSTAPSAEEASPPPPPIVEGPAPPPPPPGESGPAGGAAPPGAEAPAAVGTAGPAPSIKEAPYASVQVFYATDRKPGNLKVVSQAYGAERSRDIAYGDCIVAIPRSHKPGVLETPSVLRFEFHYNPAQHVTLLSVAQASAGDFFGEVAGKAQSGGRQALIFVHGYNVSFADAARRTAQIAYDLRFPGAPVFFSWPARGQVADYMADEATAEWAQPAFERFLADFAEKSGADHIYLIAHSMGNRIATRSLIALARNSPELAGRISAVVLAAPDIDADTFRDDIAPAIIGRYPSFTLYASSRDKALIASQKVHAAPRAGEAGKNLIVLAGMDTIDASGVDTSFLGHSYVGERSVLSDLFYLFRGDAAKDRSDLESEGTPPQLYWAFRSGLVGTR